MTTHHIKTGTGADGTRFARIMRDGLDGGRGLTVRAPSNRTADAGGVDMGPQAGPRRATQRPFHRKSCQSTAQPICV